MNGPEPVVLAVVLCDAVHTDHATGKRTLLGTFSRINASHFPVTHPRMAVYVCLTECHGDLPLTFRIADASDDRAIFEASNVIEVGDPLAVVELDIQLGALTFPEPGEYRVQILSNGPPLLERRLLVVAIAVPDHTPEGG
ncbi:hypothetical protein J8F10_29675 [Gemmata sp. G18]|uniref:DUF4469 domain-containing protein n=1 Tax=Gemmata palustris TaxID=2822762 RepID=A0ABS5C0F7_9BACT|nr:hypothetical protein [Gemmata palustris]MBP3959434.1 hypothetical protein [Gemmata palustris]